MTSCVVKWCKRRKEGSKNHTGITYHRFPKNEIRRMQWIAAVQLERREDDWLPTNASRVCSIHFEDDDMYSSGTGNRMVKKCAVPVCTMVRNNSCHLQEQTLNKTSSFVQERTERQKQTIHSKEKLPIPASEIATSINESSNKSNIEPIHIKNIGINLQDYLQNVHLDEDTTTCENHTSSEIDVPIKQTEKRTQAIDYSDDGNFLPIKIMKIQHDVETVYDNESEKARVSCDSPISIPSSDIESVFYSPREQYLSRQLRKKTLLAEKRLKKIKTLQRKCKRLLNRNIKLKDVIKTLKK